jgi:signal transduction histidine kinase/ActR/RegA family two-component response regulator
VTSRFRNLPIRRKLLMLVVASSVPALVLASAGFLAWDFWQFTSAVQQDMRTQAVLVADTSASAVEFGFDEVARGVVQPLARRPNVQMACLYLQDDSLLAGFERSGGRACPARRPQDEGLSLTGLDVLEAVRTTNGGQVGWLYIHRDLGDLRARLQVAGATVLGLLLLAIVAAFLVSARLQQVIARPLLDLAETTRQISTTRDYSLRAIPGSQDEVGVVVHAVNDMLDRIDERTSELSKANAELEREVRERRRVEDERAAALERERDANRLKDEFLATLSHELRTPLNAVLGWTRVLQTARVEPAVQARALDSIGRNARAQARLIEDLLEISRIVTGKLRLQVSEVDLAAIVDAAVEVVQPAAAAKRIRLMAALAVRPALTNGDPDRLQQVIWNLLSNAVKFTPPDGDVSVTLERLDGYRVTVRDSGPGIDPRFLPFVFDPFRQADASASREHGGLGLGLAIAKRLVELHGGTIRARRPDHGLGAVLEVVLPSVVPTRGRGASAAVPAEADSAETAGSGLLRNLRLLVVDDEEDARELLETALTGFGADVVTASSVADAFAEIDRRRPDVLLSDIGMPNEDGLMLIQRLRERPADRGGAIPAIAITAYAAGHDRAHAEAVGYQAHIAKPYEPADVARAVARLARPFGVHRHETGFPS